MDTEAIFRTIIANDVWNSKESYSGLGSEILNTVAIREFVANLIKTNAIKSILDAPCGDCNWQMQIKGIDQIAYTGMDIVSEVIKKNKQSISNKNTNFLVQDITNQTITETYDLVIMRDFLQHIPIQSGMNAISNVVNSRSTYLMTNFHVCNNVGQGNANIKHGEYYKVNVLSEPFNFPAPVSFFSEHPELPYETKAMGLWKIDELRKVLVRK